MLLDLGEVELAIIAVVIIVYFLRDHLKRTAPLPEKCSGGTKKGFWKKKQK